MSVQATTWVIANSQHKGASLLVLLMIANHAHADGTGAYPSVATLAAECRMSDRQVRRIIDALEASGELTIECDAGPRGTNLYTLARMPGNQPDKMSGQRATTGQDVRTRTGQNVRKKIVLPDISDTATGHFDTALPDIALSPEPSLEPSLNHQSPPATQEGGTPPAEQPASERRDPNGTRLTLTELPSAWRSYCETKRPDLNPGALWEDFRDYWRARSGKDAKKTDWDATWQRWVRNQDPKPHLLRATGGTGRAPPRTGHRPALTASGDGGPPEDKDRLMAKVRAANQARKEQQHEPDR